MKNIFTHHLLWLPYWFLICYGFIYLCPLHLPNFKNPNFSITAWYGQQLLMSSLLSLQCLPSPPSSPFYLFLYHPHLLDSLFFRYSHSSLFRAKWGHISWWKGRTYWRAKEQSLLSIPVLCLLFPYTSPWADQAALSCTYSYHLILLHDVPMSMAYLYACLKSYSLRSRSNASSSRNLPWPFHSPITTGFLNFMNRCYGACFLAHGSQSIIIYRKKIQLTF